jgi:threonine/homoserine/homoserine lactone efflux protein
VDGSLAAFISIAVLVIVTPGQDTALTIRNTLRGGRNGGLATAGGVAAGQACWSLAASLGVTSILVASEQVFQMLKLIGAMYLLYLGAHSLWLAVRGESPSALRGGRGTSTYGSRTAFRDGLVSNLANPKMALFFSSLLPQFVAPGESGPATMLLLGCVFVSMTLSWLSLYAALISRFGIALSRPAARRTLHAVTGVVLVAFGSRLALERP